MKKKKLMKGYMGVKFEALCQSEKIPKEVNKVFQDFKYNTERLKKYNMTPENGGNMSCRVLQGFAVTASGCNLGIIEPSEIIYVTECFPEENRVHYYGPVKPSSETLMHYIIYKEHPEALAIIHAHDEAATAINTLFQGLKETEKEVPYGTVDLATLAIQAFSEGSNIIMLKNHGYVSRGKNLTEAADIIIDMHKKLLNR